MFLNYELIIEVFEREQKRVEAYLERMPQMPPGGRAKGKMAGWRRFQRFLVDHESKCKSTIDHCRLRRKLGV